MNEFKQSIKSEESSSNANLREWVARIPHCSTRCPFSIDQMHNPVHCEIYERSSIHPIRSQTRHYLSSMNSRTGEIGTVAGLGNRLDAITLDCRVKCQRGLSEQMDGNAPFLMQSVIVPYD